MSIETTLAEIQARANAATPGPWDYYWGWNMVFSKVPNSEGKTTVIADYCNLHLEDRKPEQVRDDMAFHAHSRTDVDRLLAALRHSLETSERLSQMADEDDLAPFLEQRRVALCAILEGAR